MDELWIAYFKQFGAKWFRFIDSLFQFSHLHDSFKKTIISKRVVSVSDVHGINVSLDHDFDSRTSKNSVCGSRVSRHACARRGLWFTHTVNPAFRHDLIPLSRHNFSPERFTWRGTVMLHLTRGTKVHGRNREKVLHADAIYNDMKGNSTLMSYHMTTCYIYSSLYSPHSAWLLNLVACT